MHNPKTLTELYSGDDLSQLFKGGFINFGYWDQGITAKPRITEEDAISANKTLYQHVFNALSIDKNDSVLEVGSGHGTGCCLAAELYHPHSIIGLDYFQSHVDLATARHQNMNNKHYLRYLQGKAESIPLPAKSISKLYTIEAFQHFKATESIAEFTRVLDKNGILVIATFFATKQTCFTELLELIPRPALLSDEGNETDAALPEVLAMLKTHHFNDIHIESIGEHVWKGYDKWVRQNLSEIWDTHWITAYEKGLLDYYIITAKHA